MQEFIKQLICFSTIIIRKQIMLRKLIKQLDIRLSTQQPLEGINHVLLVLFSQVQMAIYTFMFRPFDDPSSGDLRNERTGLHLFVQEYISEYINPSFLVYPLIIDLMQASFELLAKKISKLLAREQFLDTDQ